MQIDLRSLRALGWGEPPANKIFLYKPTPRSNFCLLAPTQFFTLQDFSDEVTIGGTPGVDIWGWPLARCRARVKWEAPDPFQEHCSKANTPFGVGDPVGPGVRWALKNKILLCKHTSRSNFCLLAPTQFSKLIPPFGGVDPADPGVRWAPKIKFCYANPPWGATFVCWPLLNCLS